MLLSIKIPNYQNQVITAHIVQWHKQEGDPIQFGDPLFDLALDEAQFTHHTTNRWDLNLQVVASEPGWLAKIVIPVGENARVGEIAAVASATPDLQDVDIAEIENAKEFRVIANQAPNLG